MSSSIGGSAVDDGAAAVVSVGRHFLEAVSPMFLMPAAIASTGGISRTQPSHLAADIELAFLTLASRARLLPGGDERETSTVSDWLADKARDIRALLRETRIELLLASLLISLMEHTAKSTRTTRESDAGTTAGYAAAVSNPASANAIPSTTTTTPRVTTTAATVPTPAPIEVAHQTIGTKTRNDTVSSNSSTSAEAAPPQSSRVPPSSAASTHVTAAVVPPSTTPGQAMDDALLELEQLQSNVLGDILDEFINVMATMQPEELKTATAFQSTAPEPEQVPVRQVEPTRKPEEPAAKVILPIAKRLPAAPPVPVASAPVAPVVSAPVAPVAPVTPIPVAPIPVAPTLAAAAVAQPTTSSPTAGATAAPTSPPPSTQHYQPPVAVTAASPPPISAPSLEQQQQSTPVLPPVARQTTTPALSPTSAPVASLPVATSPVSILPPVTTPSQRKFSTEQQLPKAIRQAAPPPAAASTPSPALAASANEASSVRVFKSSSGSAPTSLIHPGKLDTPVGGDSVVLPRAQSASASTATRVSPPDSTALLSQQGDDGETRSSVDERPATRSSHSSSNDKLFVARFFTSLELHAPPQLIESNNVSHIVTKNLIMNAIDPVKADKTRLTQEFDMQRITVTRHENDQRAVTVTKSSADGGSSNNRANLYYRELVPLSPNSTPDTRSSATSPTGFQSPHRAQSPQPQPPSSPAQSLSIQASPPSVSSFFQSDHSDHSDDTSSDDRPISTASELFHIWQASKSS
ncbi:hypothetical protein CAOG_08036 [Capsaspora owczarzaki ATCC 30864]|uniref:Uncharacterized protein n=1 Tax=Capsaspora owczarzaki (strain ATCC 30864) TaxID=595528 RepID=A0A0D2W136_CAPO3|nr:hypothetical protein CAOG_08036 [Capsaspora owczarzaki ATCC 30864]KJE97972.1 hypothetical protein CAOG_008036 [Capsaspora owczarzaki ATCC 30864]|eukprot:XP_004342637.1 hypothetical protein CAOG_08036 [Capsaspora owczarzaki ATCC 30864]